MKCLERVDAQGCVYNSGCVQGWAEEEERRRNEKGKKKQLRKNPSGERRRGRGRGEVVADRWFLFWNISLNHFRSSLPQLRLLLGAVLLCSSTFFRRLRKPAAKRRPNLIHVSHSLFGPSFTTAESRAKGRVGSRGP